MTTKSAPYYWAECDRCGDKHEGYEDFSAWADPDTPDDLAVDSGWHVEGGNHVCDNCIPHGPDWDEAHEAAADGGPLDCAWCRGEK